MARTRTRTAAPRRLRRLCGRASEYFRYPALRGAPSPPRTESCDDDGPARIQAVTGCMSVSVRRPIGLHAESSAEEMIARTLADICQRVSDDLVGSFKHEATAYRHRVAVGTGNLRDLSVAVGEPGNLRIWTQNLMPADQIRQFPAPSDRAFQLLERKGSIPRVTDPSVYWTELRRDISTLSPHELETLRHLTAINRRLDDIAAAHRIDPTRFRAEITTDLRTLLADKSVAVRIKPEVLATVLRDGRFKTRFESGVSAGGTQDRGRAQLEQTWFGYEADKLPRHLRPVYGYVMVNGEHVASTGPFGLGWWERLEDSKWALGIGSSDMLSAYGEAQVVLKSDVLQRTTFTVGDSWNYQNSVFPSHILNPQPESFNALQPPLGPRPEPGGLFRSELPLLTLDRQYRTPWFTSSDFVEAQVHGGVGVTDIDHVLLSRDPTPELRLALDESGVAWRVFDNETIAREGTPAERVAARERLVDQRRWIDQRIEAYQERTGAARGADPHIDTAYERRREIGEHIEMLARPENHRADRETGIESSS
ncbi:hypothetical protein ACWCPQ_30145 [Nocardia sp. NPDC001965]